MATLLMELSLTRIFSVVFYYHMAFLAISIALFGLGAGGVFSYVVAGWKGSLCSKLGRLSAINSLLVLLSLTAILAQGDALTNWNLAVIYFTAALPFFVSGTIVSLAVSETMERVDRVYFYDLLGAAGGDTHAARDLRRPSSRLGRRSGRLVKHGELPKRARPVEIGQHLVGVCSRYDPSKRLH